MSICQRLYIADVHPLYFRLMRDNRFGIISKRLTQIRFPVSRAMNPAHAPIEAEPNTINKGFFKVKTSNLAVSRDVVPFM